jgi:hypothetical protein
MDDSSVRGKHVEYVQLLCNRQGGNTQAIPAMTNAAASPVLARWVPPQNSTEWAKPSTALLVGESWSAIHTIRFKVIATSGATVDVTGTISHN